MWLELCLFLGLLWLIYKQYINVYDYWKQKGFPFIKGTFPFGSQPSNVFLSHFNGKIHQDLYNQLDPQPIGGYYNGRKCELLVRDPELIKAIIVKDFSHFRDRNDFSSGGWISKQLFAAEGNLWRSLRVKLTPTFTTGKLKHMFSLFQECANVLDRHCEKLAANEEEIEVKDLMARFTTDIISSCAFGLEVNSIDEPINKLRTIGQQILAQKLRLKRKVVRMMSLITPSLMMFIKPRTVPKKLLTSLLKLIEDTVNYRESNNVSRNDFLDLLINLKNSGNFKVRSKDSEEPEDNIKMDLKLITAQCFVFFLAGYETSSSIQTNCLYELAMHQDIQDKVQKEIDVVLKKYDGKVTYEALQEMEYLEQAINETMRKYPTLPFLTRVCTKQYRIPETDLVIDEGTKITVPVYALHYDPKYYPDPEKFNPDRFSPENKSSIPQCAFLPFGEGPRMCIGMRFGLLQTKIGIVTTLSKYKLLRTKNTPEKLTQAPSLIISVIKENIKLKIVKR